MQVVGFWNPMPFFWLIGRRHFPNAAWRKMNKWNFGMKSRGSSCPSAIVRWHHGALQCMAMRQRCIKAELHFSSCDSCCRRWLVAVQLSAALLAFSYLLLSAFSAFFFFWHFLAKVSADCSRDAYTAHLRFDSSSLLSWCSYNTAGCSHSNTHNNGNALWQ